MIEDNFDCECSKTDDSCGLIAENGSNAVQKVVVCDNRTMCILDELNQIFAERLADIEQQTNGSFELKYLTYKEWVEMLIKLMKDLIDVVQELEYEASSRIELLERKLQIETAPCSMGDIPKLRNDVSNLLELIRRAIDDKSWNLDDLEFCTFKATDFFRELSENSSARTSREIQDISHKGTNDIKCLNSQLIARNHEIKRLESERHTLNTELKSKDLLIENYISRINKLEKSLKPQKDRKLSFSCEQQEETLTGNEEDEVFKNCIAELKDCLRQKEHQLAEKLKHNECLQTELRLFKTQAAQKDKAVTNMRALAFEVAEKHDQILQMRCQVTSLEEELKKAHKKIQFKDNVIRDLRRDCKISAKNVLSEIRPLIPIRSEGAKSDSDADRQSFKSVGFTDLEITERSDHTMNTVIAAEFLKLGSSVHEEEQQYLKVLKKELDDLLRFQDSRNEAVEDERKSMSSQHMKLREAVDRMFCDLMKNRTKLYYIRNELKSISGSSDTSQAHTGDVDSGYISPEDMEPELHIINSVRSCMNELREENDCLKMKMRKLNADELSGASSGFDKPVPDLYNKKLLQEVASVLSNICGKAIPVQSGPSFESCEGQVHPICQAMMNLEAELLEKDVVLRNSKEVMSKKEAELKSLKLHCYNLEEECDNKNHTISQLQQAVDLHVHSIERLQQAKDNLETEMNSLKGMTDSSKYTALLESKNKLEVECHNQVTTINNLRQALESFKKNGSLQTSGSPVVSAPTNVNLNNPLWGWWRNNNVHDI